MTRIAVYPGSFDPPTKGHEDLVRRSLALADRVIVAVATNATKQPLFSVEERLAMLQAAVGDEPRVTLQSFEGLLAEFAKRVGATIIVRGLRAVSDFEVLAADDPVHAWRDRVLRLFGGLAGRAPAYGAAA